MSVTSVGMTKDEIRRLMRARRRMLDPAIKASVDKHLAATLCARVQSTPGLVAVYLASPNEIDLTSFIEALHAQGRTIAAPRWNGASYDLAILKSLAANDLQVGPMGIEEPREANLVAPADVRVWIVPGLAFTTDGSRLGYGGGWYDRLLEEAAPDALTIGVAYDFQILPELPTETHDKRLSAVVCDCDIIKSQ